MRPIHVPSWFVLSFAALTLVQSAVNAQVQGDSNALNASTRVLRVDILRTDNKPAYGSALVLRGEPDGVLVATCYHCIQEAKTIALSRFDGRIGRVIAVATSHADTHNDDSKLHISLCCYPEFDLAFLRIPAALITDELWLVACRTLKDLPIHTKAQSQEELLSGVAYGYPFYNREHLSPRTISLTDDRLSKGGVSHLLKPKRESPLTIEPLDLGSTSRGMSGGLVVDSKGRFAGLVMGRILDQIPGAGTFDAAGAMIPAETISEQLHSSQDAALWGRFGKIDLSANRSPLLDAVQQGFEQDIAIDAVSWRDASIVSALSGNLADFRERFQECAIRFSDLDVFLQIEKETYADGSGDRLEVWCNGAVLTTGAARPNEEVNLKEHLRPGENLVILTKRRDVRLDRGLNVEQFFANSALDVTLRNGRDAFYRIKRALPGLVDAYAIYVTVFVPDKPVIWDARLAVRQDVLANLLASVPYSWPYKLLDQRTGSSISGTFEYGDLGHVKSENVPRGDVIAPVRSERTLFFHSDWRTEIEHYSFRAFGLAIEGQGPKGGITVSLSGRIQLIIDPKGNARWIPRLVAGEVHDASRVRLELGKLGDAPIQLDVTGLLQELLVEQVNSRYLMPGSETEPFASRTFDSLLSAATPLGAAFTKHFRLKDVAQSEGWLVLLFDNVNSAGQQHSSSSPIPITKNAWLEFEARELPADLFSGVIKDLPPNSPYSVLQKDALREATLKSVNVSLAAAQPLVKTDVKLELPATFADATSQLFTSLEKNFGSLLQRSTGSALVRADASEVIKALQPWFKQFDPPVAASGEVLARYQSASNQVELVCKELNTTPTGIKQGGISFAGFALQNMNGGLLLDNGVMQNLDVSNKIVFTSATFGDVHHDEDPFRLRLDEIKNVSGDAHITLDPATRQIEITLKNAKATAKGKIELLLPKPPKFEKGVVGTLPLEPPVNIASAKIAFAENGQMTLQELVLRVKIDEKLFGREWKQEFDLRIK